MSRVISVLARLRPKPTPEGSLLVLLSALAGRMGLSLVLTMLLGRFLSTAEFGFFALVATLFTIAHDFTDMGSGNVAIRDTVRAPHSERLMLETLMGFRRGLSVIAAVGCIVLACLEPAGPHRLVLWAAAPVLLFFYLGAFNTVFQIRQAQIAPALVNVLAQLGMLAASGILLGFKVAGALVSLAVLARELAILLIAQLLAVRVLGYRPRPRFRLETTRSFFGKATVVALSTLFYHLQFQGGILFVHLLRPDAELGAFAAAFRPMTPFLTVPWILVLPLVPLLSWLATNRHDDLRRQTAGAFYLSSGVGAVIAVAGAQLAPALLEFLYGDRFIGGPLDAVAVFRWMALPLGCSFATAVIATAVLADNGEWRLLQLSAAGLAFYIAASFLLIGQYQFTGAAIATALAVSFLTVGGLVLLWTRDLAPGWRLLLFLAPAAALSAVLQFLSGPALLQLAVGGILSAVALIAVLRLPGVACYRREQAALSELVRLQGIRQ